jgi:hypothetical protein
MFAPTYPESDNALAVATPQQRDIERVSGALINPDRKNYRSTASAHVRDASVVAAAPLSEAEGEPAAAGRQSASAR